MPLSPKASQTKALRKQVLTTLSELYLFPQSDDELTKAFQSRYAGLDIKKMRDCFSYLHKKGYVKLHRPKEGLVKAVITAHGMDLVEGSVKERGILSSGQNIAGLMARREIRKGILAFLRQFPDSFSGDDEILAELKELGIIHILIDQVRFHLWYLDGKKHLEIKTGTLHGEVVFYAQITALGMDLLDGSVFDPGVNRDE